MSKNSYQVSPDSTGKSIFRKSPHPSKIPFEPPVNPQPLDAECNSNFSMVFSTHGEETSPQSCASITPLQEKFTQMRTRQPARRLLVFDQNQSHQQWDSASSEASLNRDRSASPIWGQTATCGSDDGVSKGETHSSPPLSPLILIPSNSRNSSQQRACEPPFAGAQGSTSAHSCADTKFGETFGINNAEQKMQSSHSKAENVEETDVSDLSEDAVEHETAQLEASFANRIQHREEPKLHDVNETLRNFTEHLDRIKSHKIAIQENGAPTQHDSHQLRSFSFANTRQLLQGDADYTSASIKRTSTELKRLHSDFAKTDHDVEDIRRIMAMAESHLSLLEKELLSRQSRGETSTGLNALKQTRRQVAACTTQTQPPTRTLGCQTSRNTTAIDLSTSGAASTVHIHRDQASPLSKHSPGHGSKLSRAQEHSSQATARLRSSSSSPSNATMQRTEKSMLEIYLSNASPSLRQEAMAEASMMQTILNLTKVNTGCQKADDKKESDVRGQTMPNSTLAESESPRNAKKLEFELSSYAMRMDQFRSCNEIRTDFCSSASAEPYSTRSKGVKDIGILWNDTKRTKGGAEKKAHDILKRPDIDTWLGLASTCADESVLLARASAIALAEIHEGEWGSSPVRAPLCNKPFASKSGKAVRAVKSPTIREKTESPKTKEQVLEDLRKEDLKQRLIRYFKRHNPRRIRDVDRIVLQYSHREALLSILLRQKYGDNFINPRNRHANTMELDMTIEEKGAKRDLLRDRETLRYAEFFYGEKCHSLSDHARVSPYHSSKKDPLNMHYDNVSDFASLLYSDRKPQKTARRSLEWKKGTAQREGGGNGSASSLPDPAQGQQNNLIRAARTMMNVEAWNQEQTAEFLLETKDPELSEEVIADLCHKGFDGQALLGATESRLRRRFGVEGKSERSAVMTVSERVRAILGIGSL